MEKYLVVSYDSVASMSSEAMASQLQDIAVQVSECYEFNELDDTAKKKALDENRYILVETQQWWDEVYEDAKELGLNITSSDIEDNHIDGNLIYDMITICESIAKDYNGDERLVKIAGEYVARHMIIDKGDEDYDMYYNDLEDQFRHALLLYFLNNLKTQFDWLISDKRLAEEFIESDINYRFDKDGNNFKL